MSYSNRREFLISLTAIMGGTMTPIGIKAIAASTSFNLEKKPATLSYNQLKTTKIMVDIIIPDTDTPGASKAGVHMFIDYMVSHYMDEKEVKNFIIGLDSLNRQPLRFNDLNARQQIVIVTGLDKKLKNNSFYKSFKELTIIGYYTSEIGATEELRYDPVPGAYKEIPLAEVGRAWSS